MPGCAAISRTATPEAWRDRDVRTSAAKGLATYLLQDQDETVGTGTVIDLAGVAWDDPPAPEWWRTPLGLTVARWAAFGFDAVSYGDAARILTVTRGTIAQLVARKKLSRHPDGGVVRASVMTRLLQQQSEQPR